MIGKLLEHKCLKWVRMIHLYTNFENFGRPNLGLMGKNDIWMLARWLSTENIISGKVVASLNLGCGESYESMFGHGEFVHQKCSNNALTNLLFGLSRSMWIVNLFITHPNPHPKALAQLFTPKMLRAEEHASNFLSFRCFHRRLTFESIKELESVSCFIVVVSNNAIITCLGYQTFHKKLMTNVNTTYAPLDI
jgi:hypothetical protein